MATPPERWADAIQKQAYLFFSPEYPQSNQRLSLGKKPVERVYPPFLASKMIYGDN